MTDTNLPEVQPMPYMHPNGQSTIRNVVESVMMGLGANNHDFRLRDKLIMAAAHWIGDEASAREAELTTLRDRLTTAAHSLAAKDAQLTAANARLAELSGHLGTALRQWHGYANETAHEDANGNLCDMGDAVHAEAQLYRAAKAALAAASGGGA